MGRWVSHAITYAAVCVVVSLVWVLLGFGTLHQLGHYLDDPAAALNARFWPIWLILGWGLFVVVHFTRLTGRLLTPRRRSRRRPRPAVPPTPSAPARPSRQASKRSATHATGAAPAGHGRDPIEATPGRRWVVAMFTDIVESTSLNERLGDDAYRRVLAQHRALIRRCTRDAGGAEVGTQGDGFLVRFDEPGDAVRGAVAIQRGLAHEPGDLRVQVRIGVHAGQVVDEGGDLVGRVVNLASRVTQVAGPDEILVTEPVADHLDGTFALDDRGLQGLKGVGTPRHLLAIEWR